MASFAGPGRTGPGLGSWPLLLLLLTGLKGPASAISEAGKWILDVDNVSVPNVARGGGLSARQHADVCPLALFLLVTKLVNIIRDDFFYCHGLV